MASVASKALIVLFLCFFFIIKCDVRHVNYVTICQFDGCVYGKRMELTGVFLCIHFRTKI